MIPMKHNQVLEMPLLFAIVLLLLSAFPTHAQKPESEREFDGLKGAVKSEVMESAKITIVDGKQVESSRQTIRIVYYDEAGNKTRVEYYEDGFLQTVRVYSDLDGNRVVKSKEVPASKVMSGGVGPRRLNSNLKRDTSFTTTFRFKFDAKGRRIEEAVINDNGNTSSRRVFKYDATGNLIEQTSYKGDRRLSTITYKIDSNGNPVEESHDTMIKYFYTYEEFDEKGNWIKQTIKSVFKTREKPSEYHSVTYRTLVYY